MIGGLLAAWRWLRDGNVDRVSVQWMREEQRKSIEPFEGPSIRWPIDKMRDECGWWNAKRLRKRGA